MKKKKTTQKTKMEIKQKLLGVLLENKMLYTQDAIAHLSETNIVVTSFYLEELYQEGMIIKCYDNKKEYYGAKAYFIT